MNRVPRVALASLALLTIITAPTLADVIHLKNGASIVADSWEEKGEDLIIHQGDRTIVIPRADVARVEETPGSTVGHPTESIDAPRRPEKQQGRQPTREEIERRIETLERRLRDRPHQKTETTRRLVELLNHLGSQAYRSRDLDESLSRFREALGYDSHDGEAQLGLAATYFAQGNDIYARTTLESAVLEHPDDIYMLVLLGDVYNSQERPKEALSVWERAQTIKPDENVAARIEKLRREHRVESNYDRSEAAHFTLKYDGDEGGDDIGARILEHLESEFTRLVVLLDYYPRQPIIVIVYPQRQFYEATRAERSVGGLYDGKIRVPIGGLDAVDREARNVLTHELAHAFIAGKSRGAAPRWLQEGLAQQIEGQHLPVAESQRLAGDFRSLDDRSAWGREFSYPAALSFIEFLIDREGLYRILDAIDSMAGGATIESAFETATRYSLGELREAWGESLVQKHLK